VLNSITNPRRRDSMRSAAQDFTSISSFNIANARILGNAKNTKPRFYNLKNFDFSYSYNKNFKHNAMIESDNFITQNFGLGYTYALKSKPFEPFKKLIKSKSKWLSAVKEFNFNPKPSSITFRNDMNKIFNETQVRVVGDGEYKIDPTYFKNFIWTRTYNMRWELTKSLSFDYSATNRSRIDEPFGRIDSKEKRDSLWSAIGKLGRNTNFTQGFNAAYTLPLNKFPITDWTNVKVTYGSTFTWTRASRLAEHLGNSIGNTQQKQINGELNFTQLYNKQRWLKAVNAPPKMKGMQINAKANDGIVPNMNGGIGGNSSMLNNNIAQSTASNVQEDKTAAKPEKKPKAPKPKLPVYVPPVIDLTGFTDFQIDSVKKTQLAAAAKFRKEQLAKIKAEKKAARLARRNKVPEISNMERVGGKFVTMLKRVTVAYNESGSTMLPGYMDSTRFLGTSSWGSQSMAYAFGYQPNLAWLDELGRNRLISRDSIFNAQFNQTFSQNINIAAQIEPIQDLRIDLTVTRTFTKTHSELFKDTTYGANPDFKHLNRYQSGSFSQSYNGMKTMFSKSSINSGPFLEFINNRITISNRLGKNNPYTNNVRDPLDDKYTKGYTAYSQEVLIPAFIAAYTGQSASDVALLDYGEKEKLNNNPFKFYLPKPNYRINYNGLSKLPFFKKYFKNFVVSSNYNGTLSMNAFNSALTYADLIGVGFPSFIDSNTGNYIPYFQVPNITISDQLNPLLSIDAAWQSNLTTKFELRRNRTVSLNLIDYQVSETKSLEYVFGLGYRAKGVKLPFPIFGKRVLENDLNIKVDIGLRDDKTTNTYLASMTDIVSRGQKVLTIAPTIDYLISQSLTLRFFYTRSQTIPYVSNSFPLTTSSGGLTLRFMFAQ
jgi:cell surface protein SprA